MRIKRHNAICNYLTRPLEEKGYTVHQELFLRLPDWRTLKLDIVGYSVDHLINTQILNDQFQLDDTLANKVEKYELLRPQLEPLRPNGVFSSLTLNWRNAFSRELAKFFMSFHLFRRLKLVSWRPKPSYEQRASGELSRI